MQTKKQLFETILGTGGTFCIHLCGTKLRYFERHPRRFVVFVMTKVDILSKTSGQLPVMFGMTKADI